MPWHANLVILAVVALLILFSIYRLRKKLLKSWQDVSGKEIVFYKQLEKVAKLFYENKDLLQTDENKDSMKLITRYRKKRIRTLLLQTRQNLFNALNVAFSEIEEKDDEKYKKLHDAFNELQKVRRIYNSKVLIYNQTISVFPTRYLALRMNLELKEYFG